MTASTTAPGRGSLELQTLYRISRALAHGSDVSALLQEVFDVLARDMGLTYGTLTLRQPAGDVFGIQASRGLTDEERRRGEYRLGEGITGTVAQTGRPEIVPDIAKDPRFLSRTRLRTGRSTAFLCVPILHDNVVIGTLSADRPPADEKMLRQDFEFLQLVANLLAEAVSGIRRRLEVSEGLRAENEDLRRQLGDRYQPDNMVGDSKTMRAVYAQIAQVSPSTATVLIRGQSGTGKELVARAIHHRSPRADKPFVAVNCAALPETLIESELFGHEKGAFTGAARERKGRFELADRGTLFLDEVGDISPPVQIRLLRVLQERVFERVGGDHALKVDVRVIAATSRNLEEAIRDGRFREDLYYRLNVFPIHLPPLVERREDIVPLAEHFLRRYCQAHGKSIRRISIAALNMMMAYHWPGNVRELENCMERAVLTSTDDVIHGSALPPSVQGSVDPGSAGALPREPEDGAGLADLVRSFEREVIVEALRRSGGVAAAAARELHTTQRILNYKIKRMGIDPRAYRGTT